MATYLTNTEDLTTVANAIRTKGGTAAQLSFPSGFATAINNISGATAYIVVTSQAGALLTCGSQTYQLGADETEHQFAVSVLGTYTVTASKDGHSNSASVVVNEYKVYFTEISIARLPVAYQEVEYLQSNGTQFINTGVFANQNTGIDITFVGLGEKDRIFGGETYYNVNAYHCYCSLGNFDVVLGNASIGTSYAMVTGNKYTLTILNKNVKIVNVGATIADVTLPVSDYASPNSVFLFCVNRGSTIYLGTCRIFSCKMFSGSALIHDFVPCYRKSDNVAGMYDLTTETLYGNGGSGTFIVGGDVN